ncbi:MAG: polymorphic toxin-type HINT domain-containing protein [Patescibacteria group bacterium]
MENNNDNKDNFKNEEKQNLLKSFWLTLKRKKITAVILIFFVAVSITSAFYWLKIYDDKAPGKISVDLFTGFSKLIVSRANADDNFEFQPMSKDSLGVGADAIYVLKSKEPVDTKLIKENLKVEPDLDYDIKEISNTEWQIKPEKPIEANTVVKIALATSFVDEDGNQQERDYSWAYQVKDSFKVLHSIPRDTGVNVPLNTGIEITFSHDNFSDFEKFFEISPKVDGKFEKHGRTMVFVPNNNLHEKTLYTVKIKSGLPLLASDEILKEDHSFVFETKQINTMYSSNKWFNVYQYFYEVSASEIPLIQVSARNISNVDVSVYMFSGWQNYLKSLQERDDLPWWSYSKEDFLEDTSALKYVSNFSQTIKTNNNAQYIEFPEKLPSGFYLIEFNTSERKRQAWLQVNDLAAYLNITKTDTIIWLNNLATKNPVSNAEIEIIGADYKYNTDNQGIAKFKTPQELTEESNDKKQTKRYYIKIDSNGGSLILPASRISLSYTNWSGVNKADDYWQYLYTDRPRYQTTDTIKYWGMLKERNNKKIDEKITLTLFKEGYVDYYYRPVRIIEQTLSLSDLNIFSGEMKLNNLRPDYYTLELKIGENVIKRKYITIKPYTKPAYQLSLIPDKKFAFADDTINFKASASFFEGTPVPNLKLIYKDPNGEKEVTTNEKGEVDLAYSKKYYNCTDPYGCWPEYPSFSIRPKDSELADITAEAYVRFYGPDVYLQSKTNYPEEGIGEIEMTTKFIDLNSIADNYWQQGLGEKIAPAIKIEGEAIKYIYTKIETGTYYDFINKKSYKQYRYDSREEKVDGFSVTTNDQGKYIYRFNIEPETSYRIKLKIYDRQGRYEISNSYLYYYNGISFNRYSGWNYSYYHFELGENSSFSVGDGVEAKFLLNDEPMPAGENKYLFLQLQNGLQEYSIASDYKYNFLFESRDIPNVNLVGVYFNGLSYITTETGYYGQAVIFDKSDRKLDINIKTDKELYKPGEEVEINLSVNDLNGRPAQAEVNLNLIDEAFYAVVSDVANPIETIYSRVGPGSLYSKKSHYSLVSAKDVAEMGGCFAEGTTVLMADGSRKPIEKIKKGDKVKTLSDPVRREPVVGEVTEVWRHVVAEYLIINNELKVTPVHQIYSNNHFTDAGELRIGDWMLNDKNEKVFIKSIEIHHDIIPVYNLRIDPQHTYFAGGFYVHNEEKGGGPREYFTDAALFKSVRTDTAGKAKVKFTLPDNITSWRVTAQAISQDIFVGVNIAKIPVSLPVFEEITISKEYLLEDKPTARVRAFGTALNSSDQATFMVKAPSLGMSQSSPVKALAFQPAYFDLPSLKTGSHDIIYELETAKGEDAVKLPINVVKSRLEAQFAKDERLTTETTIKPENNEPLVIVLSDLGRNQLYSPLQSLSWSWGDRVDQKISRKQSRELLEKYYGEEIIGPKFNAFDYQVPNGGITLLPYSSEELELSARIAALGAQDFDQESLAQYLFNKLEEKTSNKEEVSLALFGLASLGKPVLPRIELWLKRDDLSPKEKIYLAQAIFDLGAHEWARSIYYEIMEKYAEEKKPHIIVRIGDNPDDTFQVTALMAVLAASLHAQEREGLWNYLISDQVLWGENKNSETLFNIEKINYIEHILPNLKPSPALVTYELFGQAKEVKLTGNNIHSFMLESEDVDKLKFTSITGDVGVSTRYTRPINLMDTNKDADIKIRREYYVNNKKTTNFKESDTIEVRLYPEFGNEALSGTYQITDVLPSGLIPITKLYVRDMKYECNYWYPYNSDDLTVKYRINKNWKTSYCGGNYIKYYARVKNRGEYKAEPTIMQSFLNPEYINYSQAEFITITE